MFTMDVPYAPAQQTPIVLAQAATPSATPQPDYILKDCQETETTGDPRSAMRSVDPAGSLAVYIGNRDNRSIYSDREAMASIKITLLEDTKHGEITSVVDNTGRPWYRYDPEPDYVGKDRAVFMAEFEGKRYKIILELRVFEVVDEYNPTCPEPKLIKVKKPSTGDSGFGAGYNLASVSVAFSDLEGAAIGQTTDSTITLDTNAANYNWYIDPTPADHSEFLPTSNPNEWVAKAGSDAAGKMDMLTVLLHEYGHALGINHSADPNDFMGTTLTAGVRRLPSAEEMALMQGLVARVKEEMVAGSISTLSPSPSPASGGGEFPTLPLGTSFIGFLGLLRSSRYGGVSIVPDENTLTLSPNPSPASGRGEFVQYDWAANATLTNGSLNAADGWSTQGSVDIANGAAVMREVSTSQTRLSQVFQLNPRDRFLSFTLSGAALENLSHPNPLPQEAPLSNSLPQAGERTNVKGNLQPLGEGANVAASGSGSSPSDAFEVALLDANTGASLLGGTGQTRSDAFLNLQADGTQNLADCVTCINNADGSRTYRVDLAGLPAGVIANLSFDLIGFGANPVLSSVEGGSHVAVSDVRLSGLPQPIRRFDSCR